MAASTVAIIGTGQAGFQAAASLRQDGFAAQRSLDDGIRELLKGYAMEGRGLQRNA